MARTKNVRGQVESARGEALCLPLLFAALTGRSGHGLARSKMFAPPIRSASKSKFKAGVT